MKFWQHQIAGCAVKGFIFFEVCNQCEESTRLIQYHAHEKHNYLKDRWRVDHCDGLESSIAEAGLKADFSFVIMQMKTYPFSLFAFFSLPSAYIVCTHGV